MNSKRRAELQRKLSMGAVPRPPADLSERIKADIPQYLQTDLDRTRFTGSVAFSMRVAASILLLITTAFVTLRLLEPEVRQNAALMPKPQLVPAVTHYQPAAGAARAAQPAGEEVRLDIDQEPVPAAAPPPAAPRIVPASQVAAASRQNEDDRRTLATEVPEGRIAQAERDGTDARLEEPQPAAADSTFVDSATTELRTADARGAAAIAGFAPPPPSAPVRAEAPREEPAAKTAESQNTVSKRMRDAGQARAQNAPSAAMAPPPPRPAPVTVTASAPALMGEARADELSLKQKSEVFGISVDPNVFLDMKSTLQSGARPAAGRVNVDALVNYFAGPPARAPHHVALEVEASPAPVAVEGDHAVLRFTIDTPRTEVRPHSSTLPAATNARLEIQIDKDAVASFHRIGGDAPIAPESTLLHNLSVTGLYDLELRPHLKSTQHIATVRLRYRSVVDGKENVITREVRGSDLARDWARASRRHRLASLGAVWSESLKTSGSRSDVARRAEELATQEPEDSRARELANAASATSGGRK
jgi:hypothetical protein